MRALTFALACAVVVVVTGPVRAGTIDFTSPSAISVTPGTPITVDVGMTIDTGVITTYDFVKINIGSGDPNDPSTGPMDLGFVFDSEWTTNFDASNSLLFDDTGFYAQEVNIESFSSSLINLTNLAVGTLSIDTTGMLPGFYDVLVDNDYDGESEVVNIGEGSAGDALFGAFSFEVTPEPASVAFVTLAIPAILRRRSRG